MGNCSWKGSNSSESAKTFRVLTDAGQVMEFNGPRIVRHFLDGFPGHAIFRQGNASIALATDDFLANGQSYYLLPLENDRQGWMSDKSGIIETPLENRSNVFSRESSEIAQKMVNMSGLEVFPSKGNGNGVWRVKLVIDPRQLEEILSEQGNTEALIEKMRMAANGSASTSSTNVSPMSAKGTSRARRKPVLTSAFAAAIGNC